MMKRIFLFGLVAMFAVCAATAKDVGEPGRGWTMRWFKGEVKAVDASKNSITVAKENEDKTFDTSVVQKVEDDSEVQLKLSDVKAGDTVRVSYSTDNGVHKARKIRVIKGKS